MLAAATELSKKRSGKVAASRTGKTVNNDGP